MPTSCCVDGCNNCTSKDAPYRFYRFPKDSSHRQWWIAAVEGWTSMDQLGNHPLEIKFALTILSLERRTTTRHTLGTFPCWIWQEKILRPWPVQQNSLSAVLNGGQLERNANVANSKKKRHKSPASLFVEELSLLSILILLPTWIFQPSWLY